MYALLKEVLLQLLRVPEAPPEIPADGHARVDVYRASPRYLTYRYVLLALSLTTTVVPLALAVGALLVTGKAWAIALAALLALGGVATVFFGYAATRLDYELRYYIVTDKSLRVREGIFTVREVTLTYVNVQNVSLQQGPLERLFGIANVVVETAGGASAASSKERGRGGGHEGVLTGISNAEEVRDLVRGCLGQVHRQAGLGDPDEALAAHAALGDAELPVLREILDEARALRRHLAG